MWSPEGRKQKAEELKTLSDKVLRYRQLADRFFGYFQPDSDNGRQLKTIKNKLEDLRSRAQDRMKRLAKGAVKIGVVGLEKQGKSAFLSAWLKSEKLLPSEAERCTWSTTWWTASPSRSRARCTCAMEALARGVSSTCS